MTRFFQILGRCIQWTAADHAIWVAMASLMVCDVVKAQELEPRACSNAPIGLNFFIVSCGHAKGDILAAPSLPVDNTGIESHVGILTQEALGEIARVTVANLTAPETGLPFLEGTALA